MNGFEPAAISEMDYEQKYKRNKAEELKREDAGLSSKTDTTAMPDARETKKQ